MLQLHIYQGKAVTLQFIFFDGEEAFRDWNARVCLFFINYLSNAFIM